MKLIIEKELNNDFYGFDETMSDEECLEILGEDWIEAVLGGKWKLER